MNENMKKYPRIGIRPTIDGRMGGVRESLEKQTMEMARSAAKLISDNLRYPDGSPVKCIISDTTIGGAAESIATDEKFRIEGVKATLTVTPCWCYGSETMDMDPLRPKAVWGFNGTERPGAVYLAAVLAAHSQKGLPAFGIYGRDVQDANDSSIPDDVKEKILSFIRASLATSIMSNKSYLSIGSVSMGIAGSIIDPDFFEDYLGMRVEYADMTEIKRRVDLEIYDRKEYKKALSWIKNNLKEGPDNNTSAIQKNRKELDKDWEFSVKMTLICRDMMIGNNNLKKMGFFEESFGHNAIAAGFQGQRQWTDHYPNADFAETMLNSSFDWNGLRTPYILATENDCLNGVSMLFGYFLTNTAQIFSDVRTYWSPDAVKRVTGHNLTGIAKNGIIHLINSGSTALDGTGEQEIDGKPAIKPFWEITEDEINRCIDSTLFRPADLGYFRGGGFSTDFTTKSGMSVTMSRLNLVKGLGPVLQIAEGQTIELPTKVHDALDNRTNPTWPTTWFAPRLTGRGAFKDTYSVMNNWGANHGAVSYGHIGSDLITLASMLRIPVCMHNIEEDKIFRPSSWNAFGTGNKESADYFACKNYGPLYGKIK
ncbi:MAG: L-fucose isomerase [Actinobacteria bacterium]|nr:L-fucose isomerase [Actinomycetota bacterium]